MLMIVGPEGAGKSHLGAIWARAAGAITLSRRGAGRTKRSGLRSGRRRADRGRRLRNASGGALFSPNEHRAAKQRMAAADRPAPLRTPGASTLPTFCRDSDWRQSRSLAAPDIELTEAVLFKLFSDRQLQVEPRVISYIALRIERSLGVARALVDTLDNEALTQGRRITRTMANNALREMALKSEIALAEATNLCLNFIN